MKLTVECYTGRKADERPVRFFLDRRSTALRRSTSPTRLVRMTRIFTSFDSRHRRPDGQWELVSVSAEQTGTLSYLDPFRSTVRDFPNALFDCYFRALLSLTRQMIDPGIDHFAKCFQKLDA